MFWLPNLNQLCVSNTQEYTQHVQSMWTYFCPLFLSLLGPVKGNLNPTGYSDILEQCYFKTVSTVCGSLCCFNIKFRDLISTLLHLSWLGTLSVSQALWINISWSRLFNCLIWSVNYLKMFLIVRFLLNWFEVYKYWDSTMGYHAMKIQTKWQHRLPGEAEENINYGCCKVNALLPLLPQNSGQRTKDSLCHQNRQSTNIQIMCIQTYWNKERYWNGQNRESE